MGLEEEFQRPWYSNGVYSMVFGRYVGGSQNCGSDLAGNEYWMIFEKTFTKNPGCSQFNNAVEVMITSGNIYSPILIKINCDNIGIIAF